MKSRLALITVFILVLIVSPTTHAARHSLSSSPFMFADGLISLEYEWTRTWNSTRVFQVGFETTSDSSSLVAGYGTHVYFSNRALEGPYIGTSGILMTTGSTQSSDDDFEGLEMSVNGRTGIKLNFEPIVLDLALKFEIPMLTWSDSGMKLGAGHVRKKLGLGLGLVW